MPRGKAAPPPPDLDLEPRPKVKRLNRLAILLVAAIGIPSGPNHPRFREVLNLAGRGCSRELPAHGVTVPRVVLEERQALEILGQAETALSSRGRRMTALDPGDEGG